MAEAMRLSADECRVLGTIIEKAQTVPGQYPITLNALTNGCNQKNNREPVTNLSEEDVLTALDSLRAKGFTRDLMLSGSRVTKYRHLTREVLGIETGPLVLLTELLLRGPQTSGELRSRAARMHPLESLEAVEAMLNTLIDRLAEAGGPLVRRLAPAPGTRAARYAQLLCPDLHPLDAAPAAGGGGDVEERAASSGLAARVEQLEAEVARLKEIVQRLAVGMGEQA